ncbi:MAG TPA: TIR domain-containing protein, partial [Phototrophicaceae bacterium]|nr:TIR domain-containing protein [Phototrophicaceae bacterium]
MRVFISYSRRDKNFAERLARDLSDAGLDVWIDFRQIHAGEMWQEEIFRGLQRAEMVIVILSPDAVASYWVKREVNTAREQGKLILPVMAIEALSDIKQSEELKWLEAVHFIRFPDRYEEAFRELLDALPGKRSIGAFDDIDPVKIPNPFKGLEAFQQTDSRFFFGREDLIRKALNIIGAKRKTRFLAVVGASGSGKSSMVRAGVIPQLRAGRLPKSEAWRVAIFTPGADPVEALATRLSPLL